MLAVSNTSPISNLAFVGRLDLLKSQVARIVIPGAVHAELAKHPDEAARAAIGDAMQVGWIAVATVRDTPLKSMLLRQVHRGEAEAIALAVESNAELLLIDEREGRSLAQQSGISVTGTLGVLLKAKRMGNLPAVAPVVRDLRTKARFFVSASLEKEVLSAADEG